MARRRGGGDRKSGERVRYARVDALDACCHAVHGRSPGTPPDAPRSGGCGAIAQHLAASATPADRLLPVHQRSAMHRVLHKPVGLVERPHQPGIERFLAPEDVGAVAPEQRLLDAERHAAETRRRGPPACTTGREAETRLGRRQAEIHLRDSIVEPIPTATPFTAPTIGFRQSYIAVAACPSTPPAMSGALRRSRMSSMVDRLFLVESRRHCPPPSSSMPAQKALPAPVTRRSPSPHRRHWRGHIEAST